MAGFAICSILRRPPRLAAPLWHLLLQVRQSPGVGQACQAQAFQRREALADAEDGLFPQELSLHLA